jgi:hypothetical protein
MEVLMPAPLRSLLPFAAASCLAALPLSVDAASACDTAIEFATAVVAQGRRAAASVDIVEARSIAVNARYPAIDAGRYAKTCGCGDAIPLLAGASEDAARSSVAINLTAINQFGTAIAKQGEQALVVLRRCAGK